MRGIQGNQEVQSSKILRDTRTTQKKIYDALKKPENIGIILYILAFIMLLTPALFELITLVAIIFIIKGFRLKPGLPCRVPRSANSIDPNDLNPGNKKPMKGDGIAFFGNDRETKEEIWFKNEDLRTHCLIFGSTGAGKTEALISIAFNALVYSSGFIYVDGKGDNSLFAKIFSMARGMGREDDVLLINFMTGARDIIGSQENRLSNTMNPFSRGSSSMLSNLVSSLMGSGGSGGDGDMWKGRAISFVEALMKLLVYMRDRGDILLDANTIRNYFTLDKLEDIVIDKKLPRDGDEPASLEDVPSIVMEPMKNFVLTLPGFNISKKGNQVSQVSEQLGYITMQLTRTFSSLADTYGHIIRTNLAEVDFKDIVLNRRILVVLLPALEKSPEELSNLGKVIIASLKSMMAAGLGDAVEGDYSDVIERKPTNAPTPFMCILDEYGYYAVPGFAVVPAQARSLGFSAIFAGQDLPAFQKASKEEAASIGANTNIKICMKLEDPVETWDFFNKTAGEAYVTKADSFHEKEGMFTEKYVDAKTASYEKRSRIDLLDLKDQTEGQAHMFFKSKIIRCTMFYANPSAVKQIRVNQFLKVEPPLDSQLLSIKSHIDRFKNIVKAKLIDKEIYQDDVIDEIKTIFEKINNNKFIGYAEEILTNLSKQKDSDRISPIEIEEYDNAVTCFSVDKGTADKTNLSLEETKKLKSTSLINKDILQQSFECIMELEEQDKDKRGKLIKEILNDINHNTEYPLQTVEMQKGLEDIIDNIINEI